MSKYFWKYPVTCNAACHAASGVGPAPLTTPQGGKMKARHH